MREVSQAEVVDAKGNALMLKGIKATGAIKGCLLAMQLEQRFCNHSDTNTEITYRFPLPWGAVLMGIDVVLNGKQLKGEVTLKRTARDNYESALSEGNTGVLLERNADLSYSLEVGNLMAREECSITIRYAQVLQLEQGQLRVLLPTTIAPRYGNPIAEGKLQPHQTAEIDPCVHYPFDLSIHLSGDLTKAQVDCPSHKTGYHQMADGLLIKLTQRGALDRDFILILSDLAQQSVAIASPDLWFPGTTAVMASFSPALPQQTAAATGVKILVDCSGSMGGDSIGAARNALRNIILGMEKQDRFTLSKFGSTVEHRGRGMWLGTGPAKASALRWVEGLDANLGGTDMANALISTIALTHQGNSDILLVTDGEIEGIDEVIEVVKTSGHRIFVVAIGASPVETHLRRLAMATGGVCDFVAPGENVEPAVLRMFSRLRGQRVDDVRVEWPSDWAMQWSQQAPALVFHDDAISLFATVKTAQSQHLTGQIKLFGKVAGELVERTLAQVDVGQVESTSNNLARMAGNAQFSEFMGITDIPDLFKASARDIAVRYQLVTEETNFILVHERAEGEKAVEMPRAHKVTQMLAAGWGATGTVISGHAISAFVANASPTNASSRAGRAMVSRAETDFGSMSAPSVWRTMNKDAAATRIDSLSTGGMDDFEIPAFLRKQADADSNSGLYRIGVDTSNANLWTSLVCAELSSAETAEPARDDPPHLQPGAYVGLTPLGVAEWLKINEFHRWPKCYVDLQEAGLGIPICDWLEFVIGANQPESEVVHAFLKVMMDVDVGIANSIKKMMKSLSSGFWATPPKFYGVINGEIVGQIRAGLRGMLANEWPTQVLNFAEVDVVL